jgi:hypothetical protein
MFCKLWIVEMMVMADDALVVWNILSFYVQILSQFVKPPSISLLRYFYKLS